MKRKVIYDAGQFEITVRELLFSIGMILLVIASGALISEGISSKVDEKNQEYEQALKIDNDRELFEYGMRTNAGNAFVFGTLKALDPVSVPEIDGKYAIIEVHKERYTMHTRIVTHSDGKGHTYTTTETYYTWDEVDRDEITCSRISFLGVEFGYEKIAFPPVEYNATVRESSTVRYKYYTCGKERKGAIYTRLDNGTIQNAKLIPAESMDEAVGMVQKSAKVLVVIFWVVWIAIASGATIAFCTRDNEWLE